MFLTDQTNSPYRVLPVPHAQSSEVEFLCTKYVGSIDCICLSRFHGSAVLTSLIATQAFLQAQYTMSQ